MPPATAQAAARRPRHRSVVRPSGPGQPQRACNAASPGNGTGALPPPPADENSANAADFDLSDAFASASVLGAKAWTTTRMKSSPWRMRARATQLSIDSPNQNTVL